MKTITTTKVIGMLLLVVLSTNLAKAQNEAYLNQDLKVEPKTSTFKSGDTENSAWDFSKSVPVAKYNSKTLESPLEDNNWRQVLSEKRNTKFCKHLRWFKQLFTRW